MNVRHTRLLPRALCLVLSVALASVARPATPLSSGNFGPVARPASVATAATLQNSTDQNGTPAASRAPVTIRHVIALLFNATQLAPETEGLDQRIAEAFDLKAETAVLPLGPAGGAGTGHFFAVSRISERKQVVILHRLEDGSTEAFLCDYSGRCRGAAVLGADGTVRKVSILRAAGKFQAELAAIEDEVRANSQRYVHLIVSAK